MNFRWTVTIFARNEVSAIGDCIRSTLDQIRNSPHVAKFDVFVLVNGSNDGTSIAAKQVPCACSRTTVRVIDLEIADKAHAWNIAVHELLPCADYHYFVDGNIRITPNSFDAMALTAYRSPRCNAVTAVPKSGRSRAVIADALARSGGLHGSLHLLTGSFVERLQDSEIRLPRGLYRGDGLIGAMAMRNLDAQGNWDKSLIPICSEAGWVFRSLSAWRPEDWRRYLIRRQNQKRGKIENAALKNFLSKHGFHELPSDIREITNQS